MSSSAELFSEVKKEKDAKNAVVREEAIRNNVRNMRIQNDVGNEMRSIEMVEEEGMQWCIARSDQEKLNIMRSGGCDWGVEDIDYFIHHY